MVQRGFPVGLAREYAIETLNARFRWMTKKQRQRLYLIGKIVFQHLLVVGSWERQKKTERELSWPPEPSESWVDGVHLVIGAGLKETMRSNIASAVLIPCVSTRPKWEQISFCKGGLTINSGKREWEKSCWTIPCLGGDLPHYFFWCGTINNSCHRTPDRMDTTFFPFCLGLVFGPRIVFGLQPSCTYPTGSIAMFFAT